MTSGSLKTADGFDASCGSCKFWNRDAPRDENGLCRRRAPPLVEKPALADDIDLWPTTFQGWWCGEYENYPPT